MPTKTFPASKPRGGVQPKHHARKDKITGMLRRAHILKAAVEGKDLKKAAIETGISPKSASQQVSMILKEPAVRASFAMIMEEAGLSDKFLAEKVKALVDAKQTLYFQKDGIVTDSREVEALETQRKTLELATKLKGHLREQSQLDVNVGIMALVVEAVRGQGDEDY